jgi:hypothetical protein
VGLTQPAVAPGGEILARHSLYRLERKDQRLLARSEFGQRLAASFAAASTIIAGSLAVGMAGYHYFESLSWIDSYVNAAMILSGMGPLDPPKSWGGKFFAGTYALYSGLVVILAAGVLFTPVVHRMLHKFHLEEDDGQENRGQNREK